MTEHFDYIVVGAGSAGCVLANRLSTNPANRVLLIECGPDDKDPLIRMPRGIGKLLVPGNRHVFDYQVSPAGNLPQETWLKGKTLGGSSAINGMVYMRGAPADYDSWAEAGCTGWGWEAMQPRFAELEDHELGGSDGRGVGGPLKVTRLPDGNDLCEALLDAGTQMGVARVDDINGPVALADQGLGYQTANISGGERFSSARAFLDPVRSRPNLTIRCNTQVNRIVIEDKRVVGVEVGTGVTKTVIGAAREVVLSAGAFETPKLLELSGIGDAVRLSALGITPIVDCPAVGENLQEHRYVATQYEVRGQSLNAWFRMPRLLLSVAQYLFARKGPMTHSAHEVGGFIKTTPDLDRPDAQVGIGLYSFHVDGKGAVAIDDAPGMNIIAYFTRPQSKGSTHIQSADATQKPVIQANHMAEKIDRQTALNLIKWQRRYTSQPALADWIVKETGPAAQFRSDEDILANLMQIGGTSFHVCGTARMGSDPGSVVDPQLRVRGVAGLRICDTSIMPTIVSANTNAPAMAMALNAAIIILQTEGAS